MTTMAAMAALDEFVKNFPSPQKKRVKWGAFSFALSNKLLRLRCPFAAAMVKCDEQGSKQEIDYSGCPLLLVLGTEVERRDLTFVRSSKIFQLKKPGLQGPARSQKIFHLNVFSSEDDHSRKASQMMSGLWGHSRAPIVDAKKNGVIGAATMVSLLLLQLE